MKTLVDYIEECGVIATTPLNTPGMGNPSLPSLSPNPGDVEGSEPGSGDAMSLIQKKKKKKSAKV